MELSIEFEALDPPEGWTHLPASDERKHFSGWLELIGTVEEIVRSAATHTSSHPSGERHGGERHEPLDGSDGREPSGRKEQG